MGYNAGPAPINWRDVVGSRLLVREAISSDRYPDEVTLLEVSPSGDYIRLRYPNGNESWRRADWWRIVELLPTRITIADGSTIDLVGEIPE
jgi:hypothetical protein